MDRSGTNGPRKPTLVDVARAAGVSRALVSIIIRGAPGASEETRARVLKIADELGYQPDVRARLLARSSPRLIGVTYKVGSLHHADLLSPIYETAEAAGYEVILSGRTRRHDERHATDALIGYRCDALLIISPEVPEAELQRLSTTVPVLSLGRRMLHATTDVDVVRTDEVAGIRMAIDHLARLGHRRIAHVDGGTGVIGSDRRRAYREHMTRLGLREDVHIVPGGDNGEAGRRAGRHLLREPDRPTAVICYNDECAWGVMRALADDGPRGAPGRLRRRVRRQRGRQDGAPRAHHHPPGHRRPGQAERRAPDRPPRAGPGNRRHGARPEHGTRRDHGAGSRRRDTRVPDPRLTWLDRADSVGCRAL